MAFHEICDVADTHGGAAQRHLGEGTHRRDWQLVTDTEPLVRRFDEAAGAWSGRVQVGERRGPDGLTGRLDPRFELDALLPQVPGIDKHLHLPLALTPYRNIRDARNAGEARCDVPTGLNGHINQRDGV